MLHADQVEIQHDRAFAGREDGVAALLRQIEEVAQVRQARQRVGVDAAVEIGNVALELVAHADEHPGERADLVPAPVAQRHVVLPAGQPPGGVRQLLQRAGDQPDDEQQQRRKGRDDRRGGGQQYMHQPRPGGVDLPGRRGDHQLHAVGQRDEGHLPRLVPGGVANQAVAALRALQDVLAEGGIRPQGQLRVVDHAAVGAVQAGEAGFIHPDMAHLFGQGVHRNVHAQHADQRARPVDGHQIGADLHAAQVFVRIGAHPGGTAPSDGREIPGAARQIRRIQRAHVRDRLPAEARLARLGIEEAGLRPADVRADAVIIGHHPGGVVGDAGKGLLHADAVVRHVGVQPLRLLRGLFALPGIEAGGAVFHQRHAVQGVRGDARRHFHRLFDAFKVLFQRLLRVLADQVHYFHRTAVVFRLKGGAAGQIYGQHAREDGRDGDGRDLDADGMHGHAPFQWTENDILIISETTAVYKRQNRGNAVTKTAMAGNGARRPAREHIKT